MANVIANTMRALIVNRIIGTGTEPKFVGWGTSAGTSVVTDTTLFGEKALDLATATGTRPTGTSSAVNSAASFTGSQSTNQLTVTAVASGTIGIGQLVSNAVGNVTAFGTGVGGVGTYTVTGSQTLASQALTSAGVGDVHKVIATLVATAAGTVTNAGTFDVATIASGNLGVKGDFTGVPLNSGDSLALTFQTQFS